MTPVAWLVVNGDKTHRALFLDFARALQWAAQCHGTIYPLYPDADL